MPKLTKISNYLILDKLYIKRKLASMATKLRSLFFETKNFHDFIRKNMLFWGTSSWVTEKTRFFAFFHNVHFPDHHQISPKGSCVQGLYYGIKRFWKYEVHHVINQAKKMGNMRGTDTGSPKSTGHAFHAFFVYSFTYFVIKTTRVRDLGRSFKSLHKSIFENFCICGENGGWNQKPLENGFARCAIIYENFKLLDS